VDVEAVFAGLSQAASTITGLRCNPFVPDSIAVPAFFPAEVDIDFDQAFAGGMDRFVITCRVMASRADDRTGQAKLKGYLARVGPQSIRAALSADRSLGGVCDSLHVQRASGYGQYEHAGTIYYGAEFTVLVIGSGAA